MSGRHGGRRGGRRNRGGRGGHQRDDRESGQSSQRQTHPPHLKGRQIGLWYADTQGRRRKEDENLMRLEIVIDKPKQMILSALLQKLIASDYPVSSSKRKFEFNYQSNLSANASAADTVHKVTNYEDLRESRRDPALDLRLKEQLEQRNISTQNNRMRQFQTTLPVYNFKKHIVQTIADNQITVLTALTGSGKTTQISQYILDSWIENNNGSICNVLCTQPRRISAISVGERVAEERMTYCGGPSIGFSIRLESRLPTQSGGTIKYCTTGVVLEYLKHDPNLSKVSHLIIDEVHERDVLCDFMLVIVKDLVVRRPDIKIIVMSATLSSEFATYLNATGIIEVPGQLFPVEQFYLEDVLAKTNFVYPEQDYCTQRKREEYAEFIHLYLRKLKREKVYPSRVINEISKAECEGLNMDLVQNLLEYICYEDTNADNAILIFLTGWDFISRLYKQLTESGKFPEHKYLLLPLHSLMPTVNQREIFERPKDGKRKIVIATNIAETSITIDDVTIVIDCGRIKITNYNLRSNIESLDTEWVSKANSTQRKGRAGRVKPGKCYHLYTKARLETLEDFKKPEVLRKRLEEVALLIKSLKLGLALPFLSRLMNAPRNKATELAIARLIKLNALDDEENLTPLGFHLSQLPMDPQTGKMILFGAIFSCVDPIFSIAASLSFKDAFYIPLGKEKAVDRIRVILSKDSKSDHIALSNAIEGFEDAAKYGNGRDYCYQNFLSFSTVKLLMDMKRQFAEHLHVMGFMPSSDYKDPTVNRNSGDIGTIKSIIVSGLYPNVGRIRLTGYPVVRTEEDGRVHIHPKSVNANVAYFECPFLVYHQKMMTNFINLFDTTMVSPFPLLYFGGKLDFIADKDFSSVGVDSTIRFKCDKEIFDLVQGLRHELDIFLQYKINNPGPTNWSPESKEGGLLMTIIQLINAEYNQMMNPDDEADEGSESD